MKKNVLFVTGIGTGVGKTVAAAILTEALQADYWKPVQSGLEGETDTERVSSLISNTTSQFHPEAYRLQTPASPHISAKIDNVTVSMDHIRERFEQLYSPDRFLIIEGAGGLMVPVNDDLFFADLVSVLDIPVVAVTNQYLGSINHTLLTGIALEAKNINMLGWIFNGVYVSYEQDLLRWSKYPKLGRIAEEEKVDKVMVKKYAEKFLPELQKIVSV